MSGLAILAVVPLGNLGFGKLPPDVRVIAGGAFAAVVRQSPRGGFKGRPRSELAPWLLTGQRVVESVMNFTPVLPVTFGTVAADDGMVYSFLVEGQALFEQAFTAVDRRIEIDLCVRWNLRQVMRDIVLGGTFSARPGEIENDGDRQEAEKELANLVRLRREHVGAHIVNAVRPIVSDVICTVSSEPEAVIDVALLLDRAALGRLEKTLDALDGFFAGTLSFRMVGPMAPYSFASVQAHFPQPGDVEHARAVLDVGASATAEEIKAAYRNAARRIHPDLTAADSETDAMAALSEAYEILCKNRISVSLRRNGTT